jgi:small subunit ribosomal protein S9
VRLYDQGTGEIRISSPDEGGEFDIKYFDMLTHREQLLFPFKVVDRVNKFDLHVKVLNGGGMSCMAKAVRYAISKALCAFISSDSIEKLRLAGLLTLDSRRRERKKAGQKGARRKFTWFDIFSYIILSFIVT